MFEVAYVAYPVIGIVVLFGVRRLCRMHRVQQEDMQYPPQDDLYAGAGAV